MSDGAESVAPRGAGAAAVPLLAFDTSTEQLAVAAVGPSGICAINAPGGSAASAVLIPQIHAALSAAGLALGDLAAIGFGRGPGAFTGLRTSCAVAQGLGLGLGRPLLPLDSLMLVAEDAFGGEPRAYDERSGRNAEPAAAPLVAVAMDARMDEIYGALYRHTPSSPGAPVWSVWREPALFTLAAWNALLEEHADELRAVAGSALAAFGPRLHRVAGAREVASEHDRARALMRLAEAAWQARAAIDAAEALPLYLRDKVALTSAERAAAHAAAHAASHAASHAAAASSVPARAVPAGDGVPR